MIIGIDPGRDKCGVAIINKIGNVLFQKVVPSNEIVAVVKGLKQSYQIERLVIGDGTKSDDIIEKLKPLFNKINIVDESYSTLEARKYYWKDNPPKGLKKLIPLSMQSPPRPIDDYVAVILLLKYLNIYNAKMFY